MPSPSRLALALLLSPFDVVAQGLQLQAAVLPTGIETRIDGALPGSVALLILGLSETHIPLPGQVVLGVAPDMFAAFAIVPADGPTMLVVPATMAAFAGLDFFAQAVAVDLSVPFAEPGSLAASPVRALHVPEPGAIAEVYVLFGQSNAEGYAAAADLPADLRGPLPLSRIWNPHAQAFEALSAGVNGRTSTPASWCGPEFAFAQSLSADGRTVYLVKFAMGATALGSTPGPFNEWGVAAGELYAVLQYWLADALSTLRQSGLEPRVRGICMMQGESDATSETWAAGYHGLLSLLVRQFRVDLQALSCNDTEPAPFVLGLINRNLPAGFFPWTETVRQAQRQVAVGAARCHTVETTDLSLQSNGTHLDTAGVCELGRRFAAALRQFAP